MKPLIVGSFALHHHSVKPNDIDVLWHEEIPNDFEIKQFTKKNVILLDTIIADEAQMKLLKYANNRQSELHEYHGCLIASPIMLYCLYKSHIHRVRHYPGASDQTNVYKWFRHLDVYTKLRTMLQSACGEPIMPKELEEIYYEMFKTYRDCPNVFANKTQETFFNRNVTRYVRHDLLHELIALKLRGTKELLFQRCLPTAEAVEMSQELFMKESKDIRLQILIEEVLVLLIERILLRSLMEHLVNKREYYDPKLDKYYLRNILSIFCTDLCGNEQHWLRWYAINHANFMLKILLNGYIQKCKEICCHIVMKKLYNVNVDIKCTEEDIYKYFSTEPETQYTTLTKKQLDDINERTTSLLALAFKNETKVTNITS